MVMTLVFPDSLSRTSPRTAPSTKDVSLPTNVSITELPPTWNPLSPISQDTTLAFAVPSHEAAIFLDSIQELPNNDEEPSEHYEYESSQESRRWVLKASKSGGDPAKGTLRLSAMNTWTGFVDLIKVNWVTLELD